MHSFCCYALSLRRNAASVGESSTKTSSSEQETTLEKKDKNGFHVWEINRMKWTIADTQKEQNKRKVVEDRPKKGELMDFDADWVKLLPAAAC